MKPSPQVDFPVIVRDHQWEVHPSVAPLYQGIYDVALNFTAWITFVPEIETVIEAATFPLPDDVDNPATAQEARHDAVAFASYVVLSDAARAGQAQRLVLPLPVDEPAGDPLATIIFYAQPDEFAVFGQELALLAEILTGPGSSRRVSELHMFDCMQFIVKRILPSPHLRPYHAYMLGR